MFMFTSRRHRLVAVVAGALLLATTAVPLAFAQGVPGGTSQPTGISVLGEGIVTVQPSTARITLGVEIFDASLAKALADAASRMDAVVQRLRAGGIPETDIRTVSFSVSPQYDSRGPNETFLRGYQVQNLVEVRSTNVGDLGRLLDDVVASGATRVFGIRFEADDMERLKGLARDQAMQNARAKAEQLARGAGVSLGRAVYVEESDTGGVTPIRAETLAAPAAAGVARTPIQPGETQVRTIVRVLWAVQ